MPSEGAQGASSSVLEASVAANKPPSPEPASGGTRIANAPEAKPRPEEPLNVQHASFSPHVDRAAGEGAVMKTGRQVAVVATSILVVMMPSVVYPQTLDDFKTASLAKGVESIPFSSLRGDAASIQRDIENWKRTTASFSDWKEYDRSKAE